MPPRKSTGSADGDEAAHGKQPEVETGANIEDYLLPRSLTQRLAKGVLPPNTAIHKDALLAISKAATVFVSYLSSHANEETQKKTVTPQDVLAALSEIEFDSFRPRIEKELAVYMAAVAQKRKGKKDGKDSAASAAAAAKSIQAAGTDTAAAAAAGDDARDSEPDAKRLKRDGIQQGEGTAGGKSAMKNGVDDDETDLEEEEEHVEEGREEDEEEQEEDEEEEEEAHADEDPTQLEDELEAADSDTARRRRNPDMDSDLDSDSD